MWTPKDSRGNFSGAIACISAKGRNAFAAARRSAVPSWPDAAAIFARAARRRRASACGGGLDYCNAAPVAKEAGKNCIFVRLGEQSFSHGLATKMKHLARTKWLGATLSIVAASFLVGGACLYAQAVSREHAHNWEPLTLPVVLRPGTIRIPDIATDRDGEYDIVVDFEEKYDIRTMECLLGIDLTGTVDPNRCKHLPTLIDISWKLMDGGKLVSEGDSGNNPSYDWSSTVERSLGEFKGQTGHRYTLVLDVKRDAAQLNAANPKIKIEVPRGISKDYAVGTYIQKLEAIVMGLIGVSILLGLLVVLRLRWKKNLGLQA
jgi:hypothetical protein